MALPDYFWPFLTLSVSASFTPGPNNLMITASGANFGYWRSFPHILGVALGFPLMFILLAFGLGEVFARWPFWHEVLRYLGAAFLFYLAWRIGFAPRAEAPKPARPLSFLEASAFQWINPKGVLFAISVIATFTAGATDYTGRVLFMALVLVGTAFTSISTWCVFGIGLGRLLRTDRALRLFNLVMGALLAGSVVLLFL